MIKIYLKNEDELCKRHYKGCKDSILERLKTKLTDPHFSHFYDLLNFIKERLEDIIIKNPEGLVKIQNEFFGLFYHILKPKKDNSETYELIDGILNYKSFSSKATNPTKWDAYKLAESLGVSVCPYCNRLYTNTVTKNREKIIRPDFDHFFPKSLYPLFQMSFYNLIPTCTICNSRLKGNKYVNPKKLNKYIHPYINEFGNDGKFTFILILKNKKSDLYSKENLGIKITNSKSQTLDNCKLQIKNNCEMFHIEDIYQMHTDVVSELIKKFTIYNDIYIEFLKSFDSLQLSRSEIYKMVFGNFYEPKDFHKRPLAKLTRDIYNELV